MAVVLLATLALAYATSRTTGAGSPLASLPVPEGWEKQSYTSAELRMTPAWRWRDPSRPERSLIAGSLRTRVAVGDPVRVLDEITTPLLRSVDGAGRTRGEVDRFRTNAAVGARYRGVGPRDDGRIGQYLVTVLTPLNGDGRRHVVLFLHDAFADDDAQAMKDNAQLMSRLWSSVSWPR